MFKAFVALFHSFSGWSGSTGGIESLHLVDVDAFGFFFMLPAFWNVLPSSVLFLPPSSRTLSVYFGMEFPQTFFRRTAILM